MGWWSSRAAPAATAPPQPPSSVLRPVGVGRPQLAATAVTSSLTTAAAVRPPRQGEPFSPPTAAAVPVSAPPGPSPRPWASPGCGGGAQERRSSRPRRRRRRPPPCPGGRLLASIAGAAGVALVVGGLLSPPLSAAASLLGGNAGRGPPAPPGPRGLSDQSGHVRLGAGSGAVVAVGDFNRDRYVDVLVADTATLRSLRVRLWRHASFAFEDAPGPPLVLDSSLKSVQTADLDGDGALDVLVCDGTDTVVWYGNGQGGFGGRSSRLPGVGPDALVMDANADLRPDLFVGGADGSRTFWVNQGNGSFVSQRWDFGGGVSSVNGTATAAAVSSTTASAAFAAIATSATAVAPAAGRIPSVEGVAGPAGWRLPATARRVLAAGRALATGQSGAAARGSGDDAGDAASTVAAASRHAVAARAVPSPPTGGCAVVSPSSAAFVDMDGDCLPDLLLPTTCGLEVWSNPAAGGGSAPFWALTLPPGAVDRDAVAPTHTLFGRDVYDAAAGDGMVVLSDFNADGAIDVGVLNGPRKSFVVHLNGPVALAQDADSEGAGGGALPSTRLLSSSSSGDLCVPAISWGLTVGGGLAPGDAHFAATTLGPIFRKVSIPPTLRVGDYDLDGLPDLVGVSPAGHVQLYRNMGGWGTPETVAHVAGSTGRVGTAAAWLSKHRRRGRERRSGPPGGGDGNSAFVRVADDAALRLASDRDAVAATFFDTDESGRQDLLIIKRSNETRLVWNEHSAGTDSLFFKGTAATRSHHGPPSAGPTAAMDASGDGGIGDGGGGGGTLSSTGAGGRVGVVPLVQAAVRSSSTRPAAAAAAGASFKITFASRSGHERHTCSQCPQSAHFALQPCACVFGLLHISNYIQEMAVGAGAASRSWANLMPNSLAVVWAAPAANSDGWWMEYFTQRRGGQMLGVVAALAVGLGVCGAAIAYLRHQERKEDWEERRERSERVSLFNFAAF
ncbi:hypothetical protein MMPV_009248 [Pyropia vietnamensis]